MTSRARLAPWWDGMSGLSDPLGLAPRASARSTRSMATKSRAELKREYRERPREAGIYQIRNRHSGKIFLGSSRNLHGPLNRHRFALRVGKHANPALQRDFHEQGEDAFDFEI